MTTPTLPITADMRESRSGLVQRLEKSGVVSVSYADLAVGDFLLSPDVVVERKEATDFVLSIMDKRLFGQIAQMKATYTRSIVMIEGSIFGTRSAISHDALRGALSWMTVIEGVSLVQTANVEESAWMIEVMARHAQEGLGYEVSLRGGKPKNLAVMSQFAVEGLPGCGPGTAKKLLAHFGSVSAVMSATADDLCLVKGVGRKTAEQIRELLDYRVDQQGSGKA
jgi:Fanconi anemia group M protein